MNPFNLFTNKNDLIKVLSIGGVLIFIFSLIYPLEKEKSNELISKELDYNICKFNEEIRYANLEMDGLIDLKINLKNQYTYHKIQDSVFQKKVFELTQRRNEIETQVKLHEIRIQNQKQKIKILKKYQYKYNNYSQILFWGGLLSSIFGFLVWFKVGYEEYNKNKLKPNEPTN